LLWMLLPMGLYLFAVVRPGNHYYVYMPPLVILAALTIERGRQKLAQAPQPILRRLWPALAGLLLVGYGLSAWYEHLVFMRTDLEYLLTYPQHQSRLFPSDRRFPFDIRIGWGFPYRLGWQTVSELYRQGELAGDWYGTDEGNSLTWYTLGWPNNPCYPRYYMLTEIGYQEPALDVPAEIIAEYYTLRGIVQVNEQPRLQLYEFAPFGRADQPITYHEPNVRAISATDQTVYRPAMFKGAAKGKPIQQPAFPLDPPQRFKPHPEMLAQLADVYQDPNTVKFQDAVSLLGYDLDLTWARPGGLILVTLYWQADSAVFLPYKVFTHLGQNEILAQADAEPGCGHYPTYTWRSGDRFVDRHAIFLSDDIPPGQYPLQVGLYELRSNLRMDRLDELGNPAGVSLILPAITVGPEQE